MKRDFTAEQRLAILELKRDGAKISDLCRQYGFSKQTYYRWQAKYGGILKPYASAIKIIEDEERRLQKFNDIPGVNTENLQSPLR